MTGGSSLNYNSISKMLTLRPTLSVWIRLAVPALILGQAALNIQLRGIKPSIPDQNLTSRQKDAAHINPILFKALTFSHWMSGVDWIWIRSLLDDSSTKVKSGEHPTLYFDLMLATDLDPGFFEAYYDGAQLLAVIRDDGAGARDLLIKAQRFRMETLPSQSEEFKQRYWPNPWSIPLLLAYVHLFELNDLPGSALAFKEVAALPGSPPYVQSLVARFEKPGGEYEVGLRLLNFMISSQKEPKAIQELEEKRKALFLSHFLYRENSAFQGFRANAGQARSWEDFVRSGNGNVRDPMGGSLSIVRSNSTEGGRITSSTPHVRVFGLE